MALAIPLWAVIVIPTVGVLFLFFLLTVLRLRRRPSRLSQHDDIIEEEPQTMARYKVRRGRMVPASWNVSLTGSMFGMHQFQNLEEDNLTGGRRMTRSRSPFSFFSDRSRKNRSMLSFTPSEKSRNLDDIGTTTPTRENNREFLNNVDQAFLSKVPAAKVAPIPRSRTGTTIESGGKRKVKPGAIPQRTSSYRERTFQAQRHPHDTLSRVLSPIQASPRDSPHTVPKSPLSAATTLAGHTSPETAVSSSSAGKDSRSKVVGTPSPLNPRSAWLQSVNDPSGNQTSPEETSQRPTSPELTKSNAKVSSSTLKDGTTSSTPPEKSKNFRSQASLPPNNLTPPSSSSKSQSKFVDVPTPHADQTDLSSATTTSRAPSRNVVRPKTTFDSSSRPKTSSSVEDPASSFSDATRPKSSYFPRQKSSSTVRPTSTAPPAPPPKSTSAAQNRPSSSVTTKSRPFTNTTSLISLSSDFTIASAHPTSVLHVKTPPNQSSSVSSPQAQSVPSRQPPPLPSLPNPTSAPTPPKDDAAPITGGESNWRPPSAWDKSKFEKETDRSAVRKSSIGLGGVEVGVTKKGSVLRKKSLKGSALMKP